MKIYNNEKIDGLSDKIIANKSIAMDCILQKVDVDNNNNLQKKAKASIGQEKDFDLYYMSSVLASVGVNANDDTFLAEELWAAKDTPIHKQFNYGHNEKDIIGCIFDSFLLDTEGKLIESEDKISEIQDICTYSAIWTKWGDEELQDRMNTIIAAIDSNELYVSMEALFNNFDYLLVSDNDTKVVERSEATSFLTKHLRSFGGEGIYNDYKVKRVLRNFTFSGKGLVANPANKRSVIDPNIVIISKGSDNNNENESEINMSDVYEKQIADLQTKLETALAANDEMKKEYANEKEKAVSVEIDSLTEKVEALEAQNKELTSLAESMKEDVENKDKEAKDAKAAYDKDLKEKEDKIEAMEQDKVKSARVAQLVEAGQKVDEANKLCETFASANDEQFETLVSLYKVENSDQNDDTESAEASDEGDTEGEDFETIAAKASANINSDTNTDSEDGFDLKAIAEEVGKALLTNTK